MLHKMVGKAGVVFSLAMALMLTGATSSSDRANGLARLGCYLCDQDWDGEEWEHSFAGLTECTPEQAYCMQCGEFGNECHTESESGQCNVHLPCGETLVVANEAARIELTDIHALKGFVRRHGRMVHLNAARNVLQLMDCSGKVRGQIPLSVEVVAALE